MTNQKESKGFSLIELLIVVAIILIVASIAIPNLLRSKMSANEAAAVSVLRNVHNSQAVYIAQFANVGYASSLLQIGPGSPCDPTHACLTDALVGCAVEPCLKGGYLFYMNSSAASATVVDYTASATPTVWAKSGQKNFCTTEDGVIRFQGGSSLGAGAIHSNCIDAAQYRALGN